MGVISKHQSIAVVGGKSLQFYLKRENGYQTEPRAPGDPCGLSRRTENHGFHHVGPDFDERWRWIPNLAHLYVPNKPEAELLALGRLIIGFDLALQFPVYVHA